MKKKLGFLVLLVFAVLRSEAQTAGNFDFSGLPDTNEARVRYLTSVITANWNSVVRFPETYFTSFSGRVQISVDKQTDFFYVRFLRETNGQFPLAAPGNVIIQRNFLRNGDIIQAKLFLTSDPSCYIRLYPYNERTKIDIVLYGAVVKQGMILPELFYYLLRDHVSRVLAYTGNSFDWGAFYRTPSLDSDSEAFRDAFTNGRLSASGQSQRLLAGLTTEHETDRFLTGPGRTLGAEEITDRPDFPFADDLDPNQSAAYKPFPARDAIRGFPLSAAAAVIHHAALDSSRTLFAAFVQDGAFQQRILFFAEFGDQGVFKLDAYDPFSRSFIDWPDFLNSHRKGSARLVSFPTPKT